MSAGAAEAHLGALQVDGALLLPPRRRSQEATGHHCTQEWGTHTEMHEGEEVSHLTDAITLTVHKNRGHRQRCMKERYSSTLTDAITLVD